ncbi:hypothetical protein K9B35_04235 [Sphingomonas sp. R647]|uniref:hypothetical protein n=1 Tax=Sphingomonas sp. R647 TaxID=2875233 RepID=UPI001CD243BA|nr:hypothetical protein [Sphingomonas sp. R647]MCA1197163.1 hypothetical protein [Sphingomonas sp. R647]
MKDSATPGLAQQLIFQLLYPAFLGAFIFAIWQSPPGWPWSWWGSDTPPWGVLLAVYCALQFARTHAARTDRLFWLFDAAELILLISAFSRLGYGGPAPGDQVPPDGVALLLMIALFVLPPLRWFIAGHRTALGWGFAVLSGLAVAALALACGAVISPFVAFWITAIALLVYVACLLLQDCARFGRGAVPPPIDAPQSGHMVHPSQPKTVEE